MSEREIIVRCRARGTGYRMACGVSRGVARVRVYGMLAVLHVVCWVVVRR